MKLLETEKKFCRLEVHGVATPGYILERHHIKTMSSAGVYLTFLGCFLYLNSKITPFFLRSTLWERVWHCTKPCACVHPTLLLFGSNQTSCFRRECDFRDFVKLQEFVRLLVFPLLRLLCASSWSVCPVLCPCLGTRTAFPPHWVFWAGLPFSIFRTLLSL